MKKDRGKIEDVHRKLKLDDLPGNVGIGHCLHPETIVQLGDGRITRISEIDRKCHVWAYRIHERKFVRARALCFRHPAPPYLHRIKTQFTEIVCTGNHRLLVAGANGKIVEKRVRDIERGDLLLCAGRISIGGRSKELRDAQDKQYIALTAEGATKVSFPRKTGKKLMQLVGYMLGSGHLGKRTVRIEDMDRSLLERYNELFRDLFGISGRIVRSKRKDAYSLEINDERLCEWFTENFPELRRGEFPTWIGGLPEPQVLAFVGGFFDAKGIIDSDGGQLLLRGSRKNVRMIQTLLLRAGILSSCTRFMPNDSNWNDPHPLTISNRDQVKRFLERIPILSSVKSAEARDAMRKLLKGSPRTDFELLISKENTRKSLSHPSKGWRLATMRSIHRTQRDGGSKKTPEFSGAPVVFQKVVSNEKIKSDVKYVYDLEVPGLENFVANCIVSHNSRWATHGRPSKVNAHPHLDTFGKVAVVHNGILENYLELKNFLRKKGYRFSSQTDTEVIPNLISYFMRKGNSLEKSTEEATKHLIGSFAIAVICTGEPKKLVGVRRESPLIVGVGDGEMLLASDVPALLPFTRRVMPLQNDEMVVLTESSVVVRRLSDGEVVKRPPITVTWTAEMAEKMGYPHFTLKEIFQQPEAIRETLRAAPGELEKLSNLFVRSDRVYVVGCGTSYHAALVGKYILARLADFSVEAVIASEFQESCRVDRRSAVLAITQSGETADVLKAVKLAKAVGARVACLTNVVGSSITRESDLVCHTHAGPEVSVVATKTFASQVAYLSLFSIRMGEKTGTLRRSEASELWSELLRIHEAVEEAVRDSVGKTRRIARRYLDAEHFYLIGRGIGYPIVMEGALKIKEISYIHSEALAAGELKHGTLALIEKGTPVIAVAPNGGAKARLISNIEEIKARGATIIAVAEEGDPEVAKHANVVIPVPKVKELFSPLVFVPPLQLLAYHLSVGRNQDPDRPRSLAKSVTVE